MRELCQDLDLEYSALVDSDGSVPRATVPLLWRAATSCNPLPNLGLRAGANVDLALNHIAAHVLLTSRNLCEGLVASQPIVRTIIEGIAFELEEQGERFLVHFSHPLGVRPEDRHAVEFAAVCLRRIYSMLYGSLIPLCGVEFRHPSPGDTSEHERVLGCPARFGRPRDTFVISRSVMLRRSLHHSAELSRRFRDCAEEHVARLSKPTFSDELRTILSSRLHRGPWDADSIAAELHTSVRTLQRKIESEGTSFSAILDRVRRERALELIQTDLPLREIAEQCGLGSPRSLIRAFRRWTESTPTEYRRGSRSPAKTLAPANTL